MNETATIKKLQLYAWIAAAIISPVVAVMSYSYETKMAIQKVENAFASHIERTDILFTERNKEIAEIEDHLNALTDEVKLMKIVQTIVKEKLQIK